MPLSAQPSEGASLGAQYHGPQPDTDILRLNARFHDYSATSILRAVLRLGVAGQRVAMVSSFGADSVVLLHLVAQADPETPVLFLDTGKLFAETLVYQHQVADHLGLRNVTVLRPDATQIAGADPYGALRLRDADACCALRKTDVLARAITGFDG
ncbi:MAG: phosphoadenosine phosphosulfate reductase family protein, partial [Primorskyibacter sp.]